MPTAPSRRRRPTASDPTNLTLGVCRTHFARNLLTRVPPPAHPAAATLVRSIFAQPDADSVREQHAHQVDQLSERYPVVGDLVDGARDDLLAFTSMPKEVWR